MKKRENEFAAIRIDGKIKGLDVSGNILHGEGSILDLKGEVEDAKIDKNLQIKPKTSQTSTWHTNPFLIAALSILAMIAATGITFYLGWL